MNRQEAAEAKARIRAQHAVTTSQAEAEAAGLDADAVEAASIAELEALVAKRKEEAAQRQKAAAIRSKVAPLTPVEKTKLADELVAQAEAARLGALRAVAEQKVEAYAADLHGWMVDEELTKAGLLRSGTRVSWRKKRVKQVGGGPDVEVNERVVEPAPPRPKPVLAPLRIPHPIKGHQGPLI